MFFTRSSSFIHECENEIKNEIINLKVCEFEYLFFNSIKTIDDLDGK